MRSLQDLLANEIHNQMVFTLKNRTVFVNRFMRQTLFEVIFNVLRHTVTTTIYIHVLPQQRNIRIFWLAVSMHVFFCLLFWSLICQFHGLIINLFHKLFCIKSHTKSCSSKTLLHFLLSVWVTTCVQHIQALCVDTWYARIGMGYRLQSIQVMTLNILKRCWCCLYYCFCSAYFLYLVRCTREGNQEKKTSRRNVSFIKCKSLDFAWLRTQSYQPNKYCFIARFF